MRHRQPEFSPATSSGSPPRPANHTPRRGPGIPAGVRLAAAFLFITAVTLMPRQPHRLYWVPAAILVLTWLWTRMPLLAGLRRLLIAEMFIIGLALLSLFSPATAPVFLSAFIKSNLSVLALVLLTWTTPFHDLLLVLRRMRVPAILLTTLALMYRYLPVIAGEAQRMQRARASRTFSGHRTLAWKSLGTMIGQLFLRSVTRAERIYLAMCARGWK